MTATLPIHKNVVVDLEGVDGNAHAIIGAVSQAMRRAGVPKADINAINAEAMSGNYDHLLQTFMEAVDVRFGDEDDE